MTPKSHMLQLIFSLATLTPFGLLKAQSGYQELRVHPCPASDSSLGANGRAEDARVMVLYDPTKDTTKLRVGDRVQLSAQARMPGHGPVTNPVGQLDIMLPAWQSEIILRSRQPPVVTVSANDSVPLELSPVIIGSYAGPRRFMKLPISAELDAPAMRAIARAPKVVLHVDSVSVPMRDRDRRNVAALYTIMLCGIAGGGH